MKPYLVFKTSVRSETDVQILTPLLNELVSNGNWNFDLSDCDKILRAEASNTEQSRIEQLFQTLGFECIELDDLEVKASFEA